MGEEKEKERERERERKKEGEMFVCREKEVKSICNLSDMSNTVYIYTYTYIYILLSCDMH